MSIFAQSLSKIDLAAFRSDNFAVAYSRPIVDDLEAACRRRAPLIQVIVGPRQVGKSTAAEQLTGPFLPDAGDAGKVH